MFWKRKKKTETPAQDPILADPGEGAVEDQLAREPLASAVREPRSAEPAPVSAPPPKNEPTADPVLKDVVSNPLATKPPTPREAGARGRQRTPEQRLIEDPVRIFGEVSSLMARDPVYAARSISDLGWIIRPAINSRQILVARARPAAKEQGAEATPAKGGGPVAFLAWASVSDEIDAELRRNNGSLDALRSHSEAWRSGQNLWIVALTGPDAVRNQLLTHLQARAPQGRPVAQLAP